MLDLAGPLDKLLITYLIKATCYYRIESLRLSL